MMIIVRSFWCFSYNLSLKWRSLTSSVFGFFFFFPWLIGSFRVVTQKWITVVQGYIVGIASAFGHQVLIIKFP